MNALHIRLQMVKTGWYFDTACRVGKKSFAAGPDRGVIRSPRTQISISISIVIGDGGRCGLLSRP
jgi:hypothetical protein